MKRLIAVALMCALTACAGGSGANTVQQVVLAYDVAAAAAAAYAAAPGANPAIVAKIQAVEAKAWPILQAVEAAAANGGTPTQDLLAAAQAAIAELAATVPAARAT